MIRLPIPPMIHGATQSATWMALFSGQTVVLAPEFDADEIWRMIHEHKVNLLFFTGDAMARPLLDALLAHQDAGNEYDLSSLFLLASTAALFSTSIKEKFLELLPNRIITDSIGSSETGFGGTSIVAKGQSHTGGPRVTIDKNTVVLDEDGNEVVPGSGVRGIIAKRGHIPVGYFKDEKKTAETFQTINGVRYAIPGDYAEVEADGSVTMLGRGSVSINSGGEKIYPEEVEAALKGHPDVFDALVVGVPDPRFGQHVAAVVHPREGTRPHAGRTRRVRPQGDRGIQSAAQSLARSTRSSVRRRASPTTAGPRTPPRNGRPTTSTPSMRGRARRCKPNSVTASASSTRSSSSPRRRRWPPRSARPAASACWAACGSTTPTTSRTSCAGWTRTPTASPTASTSSCPPRCPTEGTSVDINKLIPQAHRDFVDKTLADLGVPPLPEDEEAPRACSAGCIRSPAPTSRWRSSTRSS